jgi:hypothetical protein
MRLEHPMLGMFLKALDDSFTQPDMESLLLHRFGFPYQRLTNAQLHWQTQIIDVNQYFQQRNITEQLVAAVRDARPSVVEFDLIADSMGFVITPANAELEVLIRPESPYQDVDAFRCKLASLQAAICQVDTGTEFGTGTLIAEDLVITNHHVIASKLGTDGKLTGPVTCRFDYKTNGAGYTTPALNVIARTLLASSPHAAADLVVGPMASDFGALDYAILKLDRKLASEPLVPGGDPRGRVDISGPSAITRNTGVLVLQHPGGQPMKIDLGSVLDLGATRFRHSVNTENGSSGAPVFDGALRLIGIHHAGQSGGTASLPYNEGVPLGAILADARLKNVEV